MKTPVLGAVLLFLLGCGGGGSGSIEVAGNAEDTICRFAEPDPFLKRHPERFFVNQLYPNQTEDDLTEAEAFFAPNTVPLTGLGLFPASHSRFYRLLLRQIAEQNAIALSADGDTTFATVLYRGPLPAGDNRNLLQVLFEEFEQHEIWGEWPEPARGERSPLEAEPYLSFLMHHNLPSTSDASDVGVKLARACREVVRKEQELLGSAASIEDVQRSLEVLGVGNSRELINLRVAVVE